ncbi:MAG: hypothetical protein WCR78_04110 [Arcobacteraceae bacterium]
MISNVNLFKNKNFQFSILLLIFFIPLYFFLNHIFNDYKLMNEYKYLDEKTILENKTVDNLEFINQNLLFNKDFENSKYSSKDIYFYDEKNRGITFNNIPSVDKYFILPEYYTSAFNELLKNYNTFGNIKFSEQLDSTYNESLLYFRNYKLIDNSIISNRFSALNDFIDYPLFTAESKDILKEKYEFILANIFEQNMQIFDRYYIHENSFVLIPLNEMELGKDKKNIFSQYGWGSVQLISTISKWYGGNNINNYEKAKKTIDVMYYLLLLLFSLFFFRDIKVQFIFILLAGIALFGNKYYFFYYVPDSTNFKHLLDVLIILLFLRAKNIWVLSLISLLALTSIYINKEFGIFIFLSYVGAILSKIVLEYITDKDINKKDILLLVISVIIFLIFIKSYPFMENPSIKYFFDGFYSFQFNNKYLYLFIFSYIIFMWSSLIYFYKKLIESGYLYSYIFTIFYIELFMSYIVWHGINKDFYFYSYLIFLPLLIIISLSNSKLQRYIKICLVISFGILYFLLLNSFLYDKSLHDNVFKNHKLYKWENQKTGSIEATYSFEPFQDSIDLIQKYNFKSDIYMISKYDNILSYLSNKYTGLPFFELRSTIVTEDEFEIIENIFSEKADIIFVDNDIEMNFDDEIRKRSFFDIYSDTMERDNLLVRIKKLETLKKLFQNIKNNYELVEKGKLVSVYKKKFFSVNK